MVTKMEINTKADMMRDFHKTMHVTCEHCAFSERCNDSMVWCERWNGAAKFNDSYCQNWEEGKR